jgi:Raf kinase inhibitor-like YbhB/YbcL family protein
MKKPIVVIISLVILTAFLSIIFINSNKNNMQQISRMKLTSNTFENMKNIPAQYGCHGNNINPPFSISDIPDGTKSLALVVDDPDAPNGDFVHWLVWNIPATTSMIESGILPENSVQGLNDAKHNNYYGPCPPSGLHRYYFKLFALDILLDLKKNSRKADLINAMDGHILGQTELVGIYSK